MEVKRMTSW